MNRRMLLVFLAVWLLTAPMAPAATNPFDEDTEITSPDVGKGFIVRPTTVSQGSLAGTPAAKTSFRPGSAAATKALTGTFAAKKFPGFYDASQDRSSAYNVPKILRDVPKMWKTYGPLFKKIGRELGVDPYALAAFCVFESYNSNTGNFNPRMKDVAGGMYAAGIAATQAQDVKGLKVPGLKVTFPATTAATAEVLRSNPEFALRCLASEFRGYYRQTGDLARTFPKVAFPAWTNPNKKMGAYGTQAQYVSRAFVFYQAFRAADSNPR